MVKKTAPQTESQPNAPIARRNCLHYTPWQKFVISKLSNNKTRKFSSKELLREYRLKTKQKTSRQTLQKQLKSLPTFIKTERKEQLWCFYDIPQTELQPNLCMARLDHRISPTKQRNLVHSSHRWRFSINYSGNQPTKGADKVKPFGRYKTAKQAYFSFENITVIAFKNKLNVWIHRPTGKLTTHQRIEALTNARRALLQFTRERELVLQGNVEEIMNSHHVVESDPVNEVFKPLFQEHGEAIEDALGSHICQTSHPGKIEHTGVPAGPTGFNVAKGLEKLILEMPKRVENIEQRQERFIGSVDAYTEQIVKHLEVLSKMNKVLDKMEKKL